MLMIYGATGYTGGLAAGYAAAAGLDLVLGGRDGARLAGLAAGLGAPHRTFGLDPADVDAPNGPGAEGALDRALRDVTVLLNCAGPFARTAEPLMTAAIRGGIHYLDVAAELDGYRLAEALDGPARAAGVILLPGSGGSVAMLGCLAGHTAQRVTDARRIRVALNIRGGVSRGSAVTAAGSVTADCLERVDGELAGRDPDEVREFDFGDGPLACSPVTLPDLMTIWRATGAPNIETFVHASPEAFPGGDLSSLPDGPTADQRRADRYQAAAEVEGADGAVARSVLETVNGYTFTPMAAVEAARRVLAGEARPGWQTPAGLFGNGFAETIADTCIVDTRIVERSP
ncbi:MAG TPA: saccharopine dehydrogenase NADP-binding domain-containing protein [Pseudonocardia sp.]|jgi:short subunit dehydrogenase-like uncharacterized protein|nr:saccharopine dehydrogenase NADP-binding domain-containing protein [Pseudonocardia sp.]